MPFAGLVINCSVWVAFQLVFKRHAHQRTIEFVTIAEAAQIGVKEVGREGERMECGKEGGGLILSISLRQVEPLVMKALSLGLIKGI